MGATMSFYPFSSPVCRHQTTGHYEVIQTPFIPRTPILPWPSLTRWELVEEGYAPVTLSGDRILVYRAQQDGLWIDFLSEKVRCSEQFIEDPPCWQRYAVIYLENETPPLNYQINGTTMHMEE